MIRLDHIHVQYVQPLLEDATLVINQGQITSIFGKSGCGKTSVLYLVGLLDQLNDTEYYFENLSVHQLNSKQKSELQKSEISFVYQGKGVFESFSIQGNFEVISKIAHKNMHPEDWKRILKMVHLNKHLSTPVFTLSGGEKQRLAIALAIVKDPSLIILDEPTSQLDEDNAQSIMNILKELAHKQNKAILIASHSPVVYQNSDIVYQVKNRQLECETPLKESSAHAEWKNTRLKAFYGSYCKNLISSHRTFLSVLMVLMSLSMAVMILCENFSESFLVAQQTYLDQNTRKEILIASDQADAKEVNYIGMGSEISSQTLTKIKELNHVVEAVPIKLWNIQYVQANNEVLRRNAIVSLVQYRDPLLVKEIEDNETGVLISADLSNELKDAKLIEIKLEMINYTYKVLGTYDENYINPYTRGSLDTIYILDDALKQNYQNSSAYIIYVDEINEVVPVMSAIEKIDDSLGITSKIKEIETLSDSIVKIKTICKLLTIGLFIVMFILNICIFFKYLTGRKFEFCLLKTNGIRSWQISFLILNEILVYGVLSFVLCALWTTLGKEMISWMLSIPIQLTFFHFCKQYIIYYFFLFIIPNLIFLPKILRYTPKEVLRN